MNFILKFLGNHFQWLKRTIDFTIFLTSTPIANKLNALKYINYYVIKHLAYIWNYLLHNTWWITFQYSAFFYIGFFSPVEFHCFIPASTLYSSHDLHMLVQCMDNEIILCIIIVFLQSKAWLIRWSLCTYTQACFLYIFQLTLFLKVLLVHLSSR